MSCCCLAHSLLESHVIGIHIIQLRLQEVFYRRSVWLVVDGYSSFSLENRRPTGESRVDWYGLKTDNFRIHLPTAPGHPKCLFYSALP